MRQKLSNRISIGFTWTALTLAVVSACALPRALVLVLIAFVATNPSVAKDKKKATLPELVLRARYVAVVVDPDAGVSMMNPGENSTARSDVEWAIRKWGRFALTLDTRDADLIFVLHKGGAAVKPTIGGIPNEPPVVLAPGDDSGVGVTMSTGRRPDLSSSNSQMGRHPTIGRPDLSSSDSERDRHPTMRTEVGTPDDVFSVYLGGEDNPLDAPPLWRYIARDGLKHPGVPAVDKFRKAIEEAEKAKQ